MGASRQNDGLLSMAKREDREIRKEISGPEAMPFMGRARLLLGQMKEHMKFASLSQLQWVKDYKDGVRIIVSSVFGQDKVSISLGKASSKIVERIITEVTEDQVEVITGFAISGTSYFPCYWKDNGPLIALSKGGHTENVYAYDSGLDGDIIVGGVERNYSKNIPAKACRWVKGEFQLLGINGYAKCVSADGTIIVGDVDSNDTALFVWTEETGAIVLPTYGYYANHWFSLTDDGKFGVAFNGAPTPSLAGTGIDKIINTATNDRVSPALHRTFDCSADGNIAVGYIYNSGLETEVPYMWSADAGVSRVSPFGKSGGMLYGISGDGSVIIGEDWNIVDGWYGDYGAFLHNTVSGNSTPILYSGAPVKLLYSGALGMRISEDGSVGTFTHYNYGYAMRVNVSSGEATMLDTGGYSGTRADCVKVTRTKSQKMKTIYSRVDA